MRWAAAASIAIAMRLAGWQATGGGVCQLTVRGVFTCRQIASQWKTLDAGTHAHCQSRHTHEIGFRGLVGQASAVHSKRCPGWFGNGDKVWSRHVFTTADQCWSNIVRTLFPGIHAFQPARPSKSANNSPTVGGDMLGAGQRVIRQCVFAQGSKLPSAGGLATPKSAALKMPIGLVTHRLGGRAIFAVIDKPSIEQTLGRFQHHRLQADKFTTRMAWKRVALVLRNCFPAFERRTRYTTEKRVRW